MYLKTLEIRGFKSFASSTRFDLESGVTAIVGPNGSGKSNVVDALSWVMGEQGARTLRGTKMEDVIFAGTAERQALGRAQVSLTIDNSDQLLPIEYNEVTISRTLFRTGASEYAINGQSCRLLDIQELLSDTGMGRQMHVIVGQGQLDRILQATPEERRAFIEEAAGVLKYRRRKEKAERKLAALSNNLQRLSDLIHEVSKQLTPLSRQAKTARKAQFVQAELRDAKARILADDIATFHAEQHDASMQRQEINERLKTVLDEKLSENASLTDLEKHHASLNAESSTISGLIQTLIALSERSKAYLELTKERVKTVTAARDDQIQKAGGRNGKERVLALRESQINSVRNDVEKHRQRSAELEASFENAQSELIAAEEAVTTEQNRWFVELEQFNQAQQARQELEQTIQILSANIDNIETRIEDYSSQLGRLPHAQTNDSYSPRIVTIGRELEDLDKNYSQINFRLERLETLNNLIRTNLDVKHRTLAELEVRMENFKLDIQQSEAGNSEGLNQFPAVAQWVEVKLGFEYAISVALQAEIPLRVLENEAQFWSYLEQHPDASRSVSVSFAWPTILIKAAVEPPVGAWAKDHISFTSDDSYFQNTVLSILDGVVLVDKISEGKGFPWNEVPVKKIIAKDGSVLTPSSYQRQLEKRTDPLKLRAHLKEISRQAKAIEFSIKHLSKQQSIILGAIELSLQNRESLGVKRNESKIEHSVFQRQQAKWQKDQAEQELRKNELQNQLNELKVQNSELSQQLQKLESVKQHQPIPERPTNDKKLLEDLEIQTNKCRHRETEILLKLRNSQSEVKSLQQHLISLEASFKQQKRQFQEAKLSAIREQAKLRKLEKVLQELTTYDPILQQLNAYTNEKQTEIRAKIQSINVAVREKRELIKNLQGQIESLSQESHESELRHQRLEQNLATAVQRAKDELKMTPDFLLENYGPDLPVPITGPKLQGKWAALQVEVNEDGEPITETKSYDREEQERRLIQAESDLARLGKVNPLALEEFSALQERFDYLSEQFKDLEQSKKDLIGIVQDVDQHVENIFTTAYRDTEEQFTHIFSKLFPGGEGHLELTDPSDIGSTGIEIYARPAGKKVRRLSLLSGGERSLTALAMLIAIFIARPSPFYVLDEVEAALDDSNLSRLLEVFKDLQKNSQLIIITHQKRTMEIADALYGVSMRGDGISKVIAQRIN